MERIMCCAKWMRLHNVLLYRSVQCGGPNMGTHTKPPLVVRTISGQSLTDILHSNSRAMLRMFDRNRTVSSESKQAIIKLTNLIESDASLCHRLGSLRALHYPLSASGFENCFGSNRFCSNYTQIRYYQRNEDNKEKNEDPKKEDEDEGVPMIARLTLLVWLVGVSYVLMRAQSLPSQEDHEHVITWTEFAKDILANGEVEEITLKRKGSGGFQAIIHPVPGAVIRGYPVGQNDIFLLYTENIEKFESKLRDTERELGIQPGNGIPINYNLRGNSDLVYVLAFLIFVTALTMVISKKKSTFQFTDIFAQQRKAKFVRGDLQTADGKGIKFNDVAGLKEAKIEVMEFVDYLKRPEKYTSLGGRIPHGALLTGPPGCGKTFLAKALSTEAKVPFLAMAGPEFVEMVGGLGAARVRDLFKEARQSAPCIVYIDEVDAIGRKRSGNNWNTNGEEEQTLNQLLVEMDGMDTTPGVIVIASTNRAEVLDNALLRPGRFDRHILIDLPTLIERKEIFEIYLKQLALADKPETYSPRLSQLSPGMSGADIANICNEAALYAARFKKKSVDAADFEYAVERVVAGVAKKSRILSPHEKKIVAYHEAGHALLSWLLQYTDPLLKVSIVPRTNKVLGFAQYMPQDKKLYSKEELFERMCMALGGRVSEAVIFNSITSGAHDDLQRVTKMAYAQVQTWGFNDLVGLVSFPLDGNEFGVKPFSKKTATLIDQESKKLVAKAYRSTEQIIQQNKEKLRVVAEALLENETLNYSDIEELIGPPPHGQSVNLLMT